MEIKVTPNQTLKDFSYGRKFVRGLASRSIAPVILLEAFVEGGRTYQAYKRGGEDEARERLIEETIGALFWFSGVPFFNTLIDKYVGKKLLPETEFDTAKDNLRNPVKNYIHKFKNQFKDAEKAEKLIARYKLGKIITSVVLANCLMGIVLPKCNQGITKIFKKKKTEQKQQPQTQPVSMDKFLNKDNKDVSFGAKIDALLSFAYNLENNPQYGLVSTDAGVLVGRSACARNNHERTEIIFRDASSTYFYVFNMPLMAAFLNKIQTGKTSRLDPVAAKQVTDHLNEVLRVNGGSMQIDAFKEFVLGKKENKGLITPSIYKELNENNGVMKVNRFIELLHDIKSKYPQINITKLKKAAKGMSGLQPPFTGERMISKKQIIDVLEGGAINMPEFLKNVISCSTSDENLFTRKMSAPTFNDKFRFISRKTIEKKQAQLVDYVETVIKKAKNGEVTADLLKKVNRENYIKNSVNWGIGFAVSAAFLSTFIPKIQYWITKRATGSNAFPGTADYSNEKK